MLHTQFCVVKTNDARFCKERQKETPYRLTRYGVLWTRRESNPRPFGCEPNALPAISPLCTHYALREKKNQRIYEEATKTAKRSNYICNELFTWADVYDTANHDERRAILQQFITEIRVRKDYEISITLNASFNQVEQLKAVSTYDGAEIFEEISEKGA